MSDLGYFACLGVAVLSAIIAVLAAARMILRVDRTFGSAIMLAISSTVGFVCTLPFGNTREMPCLPLIGAVVFGSIVLSTILCCLSEIKAKGRTTPEWKEPEETDREAG